MQKSKLGIATGFVAALMCFMALFGGYLPVILLVGYVLIVEDNLWLKRTGVKVVVLMLMFSFAYLVLNLVPDLVGMIYNITNIIDADLNLSVLTNISYFLSGALEIGEKVIFIIFGVKALNQGTLYIPFVDNMVSKYMN